MFLLERLFGVSMYCAALALECVLILKLNVKCKTIFWFYTFILCVMAYFYTPYSTSDLYRIFNALDIFAAIDFGRLVEIHLVRSATPVADLIYWLFAKIGNPHLLPTTVCFVTYSLIFSIIEKARVRFSVSRENVALTLYVIMSTSIYMSTIGGIRMMLSMALVLYCYYRETVEQKFNSLHVVIYVMAFLTHNVAVAVISIRFISIVFQKTSGFKRILYTLLISAGAIVVFLRLNNVVLATIDKALSFITGDSYYDIWEYIIGFLLIILIFVVMRCYKNLERRQGELGTYNITLRLGVVIALIFVFEFSIFYRFIGHLIPLLMIPTMMISFENSVSAGKFNSTSFSVKTAALILASLSLLINCARGSLSALKFFELNAF